MSTPIHTLGSVAEKSIPSPGESPSVDVDSAVPNPLTSEKSLCLEFYVKLDESEVNEDDEGISIIHMRSLAPDSHQADAENQESEVDLGTFLWIRTPRTVSATVDDSEDSEEPIDTETKGVPSAMHELPKQRRKAA